MSRRFGVPMAALVGAVACLGILLSAGSARADGWYAQSSPVGTDLTGVFFIDVNQGWICGDGGIILHTSDGGEHWRSQFSGTSVDLYEIAFGSSQVGYATGGLERTLLRTTNGGTSWQTIIGPLYEFPYVALQVLDEQHLWVVGSTEEPPFLDNFVSWSANGGQDWGGWSFPCPRDPPHYSCSSACTALSVVNPQVAFFSGYRQWYDYSQDPVMYRTTDAGANWTELPYPQPWSYELRFVSPSLGFSALGSVYKTIDAGSHWVSHACPITAHHLSFPNVSHGWAVGENGGIAASIDGGETWVQQPSGTTAQLNRVQFLNNLVGTAVGNHGTILRTVTGGDPLGGVPAPASGGGSWALATAPNPAAHQVRIDYNLPGSSQVSLGVFDASGRLLKVLEGGLQPAGLHSATWDGTDGSGVAVPRGVYFVRLIGAGGGARQQVTILR